jgi:hypothetical protein
MATKKVAKKAAPKKAVKKVAKKAPIKKTVASTPAYDNNLYNLMTQLVQEQKSLWRIEHEYMLDAGADKELKMFWSEVAEEKSILIEDLQAIIAMTMLG